MKNLDKKSSKAKEQYLFFMLDDEKYALQASMVREIIDYTSVTKVPKSNLSVKGVTNIRGELIAVVDPKIRFDIGEMEVSKRTSLIVLNIFNEKRKSSIPIALMVDIVIEIDDFDETDILKPLEFGMKIDEKYVQNIIRYQDKHILVLNANIVLNIQDLAQLN
ncbi:chemotaxis protein CheW [Sulfurimonas sp.]